ncbi:MAG: UTP--glucose-1-phosphate uridylyltransferase [Flavobacteriaceae bacterium]|nr:UTP--glucose-1-phosphate uridylyltransferase [Bacteroidia bacterium]NNK83771.1 UTP--glucose-1-phosphate uridylyltransferase [Flavobacteriaceae bacterium]
MTLLLMAAGSGSRYGKLKQFDDLGPAEEFLMEFSIFDALKNGFDHIVVITKAANQEFLKEHLSKRLPANIKLDVLVQDINDIPKDVFIETEREKPWGTAHAVWTARDVIKSDFVIINADDYYGQNAFKGAANFMQTNASEKTYAIVGYNLKETLSEHGTVSRGVCEAENEKLVSIIERTKIAARNGKIIDEDSGVELNANATVSMNFWICNPSIFNYIETYFKNFLQNPDNLEKNEIYLPFVAQEMMSNGLIDINVIDSKSLWFGVTYYADKEAAVKTLARLTEDKKYPSPLWN